MDIKGLQEELIEKIKNDIKEKDILKDEDVRDLIKVNVVEKSKYIFLTTSDIQKLVNNIFNSIRRLDIIQPLIDDDTISEIMINGVDNIFVEQKGIIRKMDLKFENGEKLLNIINKIVSKVNRSVNEINPIVDARLEDGSRVNIVLPPVALNGPIVTIRKFYKNRLNSKDLVKNNSISKEIENFLKYIVNEKFNIFISGGTATGKTTFLNILSDFIDKNERLITIEDSAELRIENIDNLVSLEVRNKNVEGKGQITIRDLIKTSLRMRPDRIIVGEVRGKEAIDMLQAMNTGHDGSISTGHANSANDMVSRLETMVIMNSNIPLVAVRRQIVSAIDLIIHLERLHNGQRILSNISEIDINKDGEIIFNKIFESEINNNKVIYNKVGIINSKRR